MSNFHSRFTGRKSLAYLAKGMLEGKPCSEKPGATAARTGCVPDEEDAKKEGDGDFTELPQRDGIGMNPIVRNAVNRVIKKKDTPEQALERLKAEGIEISLDEFKELVKERNRQLNSPEAKKEAKKAKQAKEKAKLEREYEKYQRQQERRYPGMTDAEIGEYEDRAIKFIADYLINQGAEVIGSSPGSESLYFKKGGQKIRVSAHDLPMTGERASAADVGNEIHITVKRFMTDEQLKEFVDSHFEQEDD